MPVSDAVTLLRRCEIPWIVSSWGSDIYYHGSKAEHSEKVKATLASCDFLCADCRRDFDLARGLGFRGDYFGVFPGGGGYDLEMAKLREESPVSQRRDVAVKGYTHSINKLETALEALVFCGDEMAGRRVIVYSAGPGSEEIIERFRPRIGCEVLSKTRMRHLDFLKMLSGCRISLGVSLSDGVPNTLLEAMLLGTFPIQTDPGGATSEWVKHGVNGALIPDDNPEVISTVVSRALADDGLVENAAAKNWNLLATKLSRQAVRNDVIRRYVEVVKNGIGAGRSSDPGSERGPKGTTDGLIGEM